MTGDEGETQGHIKSPACDEGRASMKCKRQFRKPNHRSPVRARVDIGMAFTKWRRLKAEHGLRSDAEVAECLLDVMKKLSSTSASSGDDDKLKLSQSEVRRLIEREIRRATRTNETRLQGLTETIKQLDCGVDYESSLQKLEARIDTVAKRAEAVLAFMTKAQKKNPLSSLVNVDVDSANPEDETTETRSKKRKSPDRIDQGEGIFQVMETTKKALKRMRSDNEALTAAMADCSAELPPPVLTPQASPNVKEQVRFIKKEPEDEQKKENAEMMKPSEEVQAKKVKMECFSPGKSDTPKHTDPQQDEPSYPPLPSTTSSTKLNMEAASYNIPQRPEVHLALIREPPGLSVLWKVEEEDPHAPPMDSYSVYMTTEKVKGSGVFPGWRNVGEVKAIDLPMCVMITKYKPGHKLCVAVVGKDTFGRYGPYSKVVTAAIPE